MFSKVLVANRGEIALRVLNACRELGIRTVAIYSEADRNSLHVKFADEAICIGPPRLADSYLNVPAVISAAEIADVEAIHPGYGLLSENANFAEVCRASNIKFIGPPPEVTRLMGEKEKARQAMKKAKVPILPGSDGVISSVEEAEDWAKKVGYPVILKAKAGGGGRGMRIVRSAEELPNLFHAANTEAANAFGNGELYMEKFIEQPRHIEFQVLADEHGHVVTLFERECSIQRRHQKLIEEAPSLQVTPKMREEIGKTLCRCLADIGYPIAEISEHADVTITKPAGTGGLVTVETVSEQLLYEIGDPAHYLTPDIDTDFTQVRLTQAGPDRVSMTGARGNSAPEKFKVSIAYQDGYLVSSTLTICGPHAVETARSAGATILEKLRLAGVMPARTNVEVLGAGDTAPGLPGDRAAPWEVVLRVSAADPSRAVLERFTCEFAPLVTAGQPGVTGYVGGRAKTRPVLAYWPTTISREQVAARSTVKTAREWIA